MAKKPRRRPPTKSGPSSRAKVSAEESLKRVRAFAERKEALVAAVRNGKVEVYLREVPDSAWPPG